MARPRFFFFIFTIVFSCDAALPVTPPVCIQQLPLLFPLNSSDKSSIKVKLMIQTRADNGLPQASTFWPHSKSISLFIFKSSVRRMNWKIDGWRCAYAVTETSSCRPPAETISHISLFLGGIISKKCAPAQSMVSACFLEEKVPFAALDGSLGLWQTKNVVVWLDCEKCRPIIEFLEWRRWHRAGPT